MIVMVLLSALIFSVTASTYSADILGAAVSQQGKLHGKYHERTAVYTRSTEH